MIICRVDGTSDLSVWIKQHQAVLSGVVVINASGDSLNPIVFDTKINLYGIQTPRRRVTVLWERKIIDIEL